LSIHWSSTRQETKQGQSPKQLEHLRKFAGFDQSTKITPAPKREITANNSSIQRKENHQLFHPEQLERV
jgi:hypothetical protein